MLRSLVGSEMCIRDSIRADAGRRRAVDGVGRRQEHLEDTVGIGLDGRHPVSYTHLTLPTIYSV